MRPLALAQTFLAPALMLLAVAGCGGQASSTIKGLQDAGGRFDLNEQGDVVFINLAGARIQDHQLDRLSSFPRLERLWLHGTPVTDAGMEQLAKLTNLRQLSIGDTKVTDAGIQKLAALKGLEELFLFRTSVTDDGARRLSDALGGKTRIVLYSPE